MNQVRRITARRNQGGFVQAALIIGLALMAVVVAAFAMSSSNTNTDIGKQKARAASSVAMKKVADSVEAYQIKIAEDNLTIANTWLGSNLPVMVGKDFGATGFDNATDVTYAGGRLQIADVAPEVCTEINRALNVTTAPTAVADVTVAVREACTTGNVYVRVMDPSQI